MKKLLSVIAASLGIVIATSTSVLAHVTVKPNQALTGSFQTFTVSVPNEKAVPTTKIELRLPSNIEHVTPTIKSGWQITNQPSAADAAVTSLTWSGGSIPKGFRDEFSFSAKTPSDGGIIEWKAYQTYSDGTVVSWDKPETENEHETDDPNSGPFSFTTVSNKSETENSIDDISVQSHNYKTTAERAIYIGIASLIVSIAALFITLKKQA